MCASKVPISHKKDGTVYYKVSFDNITSIRTLDIPYWENNSLVREKGNSHNSMFRIVAAP